MSTNGFACGEDENDQARSGRAGLGRGEAETKRAARDGEGGAEVA